MGGLCDNLKNGSKRRKLPRNYFNSTGTAAFFEENGGKADTARRFPIWTLPPFKKYPKQKMQKNPRAGGGVFREDCGGGFAHRDRKAFQIKIFSETKIIFRKTAIPRTRAPLRRILRGPIFGKTPRRPLRIRAQTSRRRSWRA